MRISSNTIYDNNVAALNQQQALVAKTQQQIASGRRILTAADDPVAAARALDVAQADAINTQFATNRNSARATLTASETTLQGVTSLLQDIRDISVSAGNSTLNDSNRLSIAKDLNSRLQTLIGLANSTDGIGNHLFSGYQSQTVPFAATGAGVAYNGDDGQRQVQVNAGRQLPANNSGADVFMRVKNGNGVFVSQPAAGNTGGAFTSKDTVIDSALITGNSYEVLFANDPIAGTVFSVTNTTTGQPVAIQGQQFTSGQSISFEGMQFTITGTPAAGDKFAVGPSTNSSQSIFKTVSDLVTALNTPVGTGSNLSLLNSLQSGIKNLDNGLENVLNVRSSLGLRINEVDALQSSGDDLGLQYKQTLSVLQDLDYNKAITELTQRQAYLQAAQKSFTTVSNLSLFSYM